MEANSFGSRLNKINLPSCLPLYCEDHHAPSKIFFTHRESAKEDPFWVYSGHESSLTNTHHHPSPFSLDHVLFVIYPHTHLISLGHFPSLWSLHPRIHFWIFTISRLHISVPPCPCFYEKKTKHAACCNSTPSIVSFPNSEAETTLTTWARNTVGL